MTDRSRRVIFDLSVIILPPGRDRQALFHYLDRDGIELYIRTGLDRGRTRYALRQRSVMRYVDGIVYNGEPDPSDALQVLQPADCTYSYIAERCIREDRRPFPLELEAF